MFARLFPLTFHEDLNYFFAKQQTYQQQRSRLKKRSMPHISNSNLGKISDASASQAVLPHDRERSETLEKNITLGPTKGKIEISIRRSSSPQDLEDFKDITRKYLKWLNEDLCFQGIEEELAGLPGCYSPDVGGCMLLALLDSQDGPSECIGAVALRPLEGKQEDGLAEVSGFHVSQISEMKRLFVSEDFQGRGIGTALTNAVIEEARRLGYKAIVLDTLERLQGANMLYRSLGFEPSAPYNHCTLPGAMYFIKKLDMV